MINNTNIRHRKRLDGSLASANVCAETAQLTPQDRRARVLAAWARAEAYFQEAKHLDRHRVVAANYVRTRVS